MQSQETQMKRDEKGCDEIACRDQRQVPERKVSWGRESCPLGPMVLSSSLLFLLTLLIKETI